MSSGRPINGRPTRGSVPDPFLREGPGGPSGTGSRAFLPTVRTGATVFLVGMLVLSGYGTLTPAAMRCAGPGAIGCAGGFLGGPVAAANSSLTMWFNVTMPDYGFWIINTVDGTNESSSWTVFEGYTIHINATSTPADPSVGGEAYHGFGVELNQTGQQLLDLAAPVGKWVHSSFVAPAKEYHKQHYWCTIGCGQGHDGMQRFNLNVVPSSSLPSVAVSAKPTKGPAPLAVALSAAGAGGTAPYTYSWNFGDGSPTATTAAVNHTYTLAGVYSATVTIADAAKQSASGSASITVGAATPLAVSMGVSTTAGVLPVLTNLTAAVTGGVPPYQYQWSLGDGAGSTAASLSHLYASPGIFGISLTVTDAIGTTTSASGSVTVRTPSGPLTVAATATPSSGAAPLTAALSATATGGTAPYTTTWIFGDGTYGTGSPANHLYNAAGRYTVLAFVSDAQGHSGWNSTTVLVSGGTAPESAVATLVPNGGSAPLALTAAGSGIGGTGNFTSASWTFGDGSTGSGWLVQHTYTADGNYTVTLRVTDSVGSAATAVAPAVVRSLTISITLNRSVGDSPLSIGAAATVTGGSGSYGAVRWTFSDGGSANGTTANHTFPASLLGPVTVDAAVTDSQGASATGTATVQILPPPVAHLTANLANTHIVPVDVVFALNVTGGQGPYSTHPLWTFGDGATTRGVSPQNHTFLRYGHYRVTVETNDSFGVTTAATVWINLSAPGSSVPGGSVVWTFTGIGDPNGAALVLIGLTALTGLFLLHRKRLAKGLAARSTRSPRPDPAAGARRPAPPSVRPPAPEPPVKESP